MICFEQNNAGVVVREKLTWLHISDIHFHPKTEWRDSACRSTLLTYLKGIFEKDNSLRPDFIFCTGDIAFGESSSMPFLDQYTEAKCFFDDLLMVCGQSETSLPKDRLFVVPGNHDVNRNKINSDAQETLTTWSKEAIKHSQKINQRFNDKNTEFKDTIKRLDEYGKFIAEYLPHQHDTEGRYHYTTLVDIEGVTIGIAGFNSAWTCAGPEDDRNIWLAADWQFNTARQALENANIRIGLIHHPVDWLNQSERDVTTRRIASDFDFWLHGHNHNTWITPVQTHIIVAAGAIGAEHSEEFGVNISSINLANMSGIAHLHTKIAGSKGWTIAPVDMHAPKGKWDFDLPTGLQERLKLIAPRIQKREEAIPNEENITDREDFVGRYLSKRLSDSLQSFSSQPKVWVPPILCQTSEFSRDAKSAQKVDISNLIINPRSIIIKAPPQYGQTCLSHFLIKEAWKTQNKSLWLYLDAKELKPNIASITTSIADELSILGGSEEDIKCVILDSWSASENDAAKLLRNLCTHFKNIPVICMQQIESGLFNQIGNNDLGRQFEALYLWALPREGVRKIVSAYNEDRQIGDENEITKRLVADLEVLNLHRTPLNCLTLLKVSEIDFDESPVNRSEMIKRVLFLLFNVDAIPTYKARPDIKDCEYVLGYFCERLIKEDSFSFSRDKFLLEIQRCCQESLIDLETHVVFDVLYANNIIVKRGAFFHFKFSYWIFYFVAQRMHHSKAFADYIFDEMRYARQPEIIEFYTGIDRKREDAVQILIKDIRTCYDAVKEKCGLPDELNPYKLGRWETTPEVQEKMQNEIADGVRESHLPDIIKDRYADRTYNQARPHDQNISSVLTEFTYLRLTKTLRAGARALRNSDYVTPQLKRQLLQEILSSWELITKVVLIIMPILAEKGHAIYDGAGFVLLGDFGDTPEKRAL